MSATTEKQAADAETEMKPAAPPEGTTEASTGSQPSEPPPPFVELFELSEDADSTKIQDIIDRHVDWVLTRSKSPLLDKYRILILFDDAAINRQDPDRIYKGLADSDPQKPILLVIQSGGGDVSSAYFIGKLCRENTKAGFEVAVPRQAKSAATLICCAADRVHMGSLSELGPIDPQIRKMPALAVKHSIEHLALLVTEHPGACKMLSDYLSGSLPIEVLGYYERAARSAVQYAERLLALREGADSDGNTELAKRLVYEYKDHGFAIDANEAAQLFGSKIVAHNSDEYQLANKLYQSLEFFKWYIPSNFKSDFAFTGALGNAAWVRRRRE